MSTTIFSRPSFQKRHFKVAFEQPLPGTVLPEVSNPSHCPVALDQHRLKTKYTNSYTNLSHYINAGVRVCPYGIGPPWVRAGWGVDAPGQFVCRRRCRRFRLLLSRHMFQHSNYFDNLQ